MKKKRMDNEAFLKAYDEYADALFRHVFFRLFDDKKAADLVQETFCRTWTSLVDGKKIDNMRAFLYAILNNLIVDEYRRKKESSLEALAEKGFAPAEETKGVFQEHLDAKVVASVLGELEEHQREAVVMRYIDNLTPKEIAAITGESANIVSVRIHRAMQKVRKIVESRQLL